MASAKRPIPSPSGGGQGGGLRERKKQKTRESIQRTALRLFEKQGYEETTIEQIAAAVEISPSTFFNYFPTKEDVVLFDAYDPIAIRMFLERPKDEPLNVGVRHSARVRKAPPSSPGPPNRPPRSGSVAPHRRDRPA